MLDPVAGMTAVAAVAEATCEPAAWSEVAKHAAACLGGDSAAVGFYRTDGSALVRACPHTDPSWHARYDAEMHARNHVWTAAARLPAGSVATADRCFGGRDTYLRSDIFNAFIRPQGMDGLVTLALTGRTPSGVGLLTVGRRRGRDPFDQSDLVHATALAVALARTIRVFGITRLAESADDEIEVLVTPDGRLLTRDEKLDWLVKARIVDVREGVLSVPLLPSLATAIRATGREPDGWPPPVGIAVGPVETGHGRMTLKLKPGGAGAPGAVRLTIRMLPEASRMERLRRDFALTPRECEVARLIAEGMSLPEIAHRLGIGQTTARTHLTRLFDKFERRTQLALALRLDALLKTDG